MYDNFIKNITDSDFQKKILQKNCFILVDFWAEWCNPCKIILPFLKEIAEEYLNKLIVYKLNVEENSISSSTYNIKSIPTLLLFNNGKVIDKKIGAISKTELVKFLNSHI